MTKVTPEPYYECDCCGARIEKHYDIKHLNLNMTSYIHAWDLCDKCANHIEGHIKALKEASRCVSNH